MKIVGQAFQPAGRLESLPHTVYFQNGYNISLSVFFSVRESKIRLRHGRVT
jgi:hypothetical protein